FGDRPVTVELVAGPRTAWPVVDPVGAQADEVPGVSGVARFAWPPGSGAQTATKDPGMLTGADQARFTELWPAAVADRLTTLSGVALVRNGADPKNSV